MTRQKDDSMTALLAVMPRVSQHLARHDPSAALTVLETALPPGVAGRALLELIRTEPSWPRARKERVSPVLTQSELGVLVCAARGLTAEETGRRLWKSPNTVRDQRKRIFSKLNVANIPEAVAFALRRGLLPDDLAGGL
jgi:DNA-binding CsgD family transcriptional regulator